MADSSPRATAHAAGDDDGRPPAPGPLTGLAPFPASASVDGSELAVASVFPFATADRDAVEAVLRKFLERKRHGPVTSDLVDRYLGFVFRGKMMRALLVVLASRMGGRQRLSSDVLRCAAALELLHSAILIHDDIIDRSSSRRGQPTWHESYARQSGITDEPEAQHVGRSMALCAGDMGFFFAFELLAALRVAAPLKQRILVTVSQLVGAAGLGELHEMQLTQRGSGDRDEVLDIYAQKTARYSCALPLMVGGLLARLPEPVLTQLDVVGAELGEIFQVIDDELDLFGDEHTIGKPVGTDVREGRHTLFYTLLERHLPAPVWSEIHPLFGNPQLGKEELRRVTTAIEQYGIRRLAHQHVDESARRARAGIEALEVPPAARDQLRQVLTAVLERHS